MDQAMGEAAAGPHYRASIDVVVAAGGSAKQLQSALKAAMAPAKADPRFSPGAPERSLVKPAEMALTLLPRFLANASSALRAAAPAANVLQRGMTPPGTLFAALVSDTSHAGKPGYWFAGTQGLLQPLTEAQPLLADDGSVIRTSTGEPISVPPGSIPLHIFESTYRVLSLEQEIATDLIGALKEAQGAQTAAAAPAPQPPQQPQGGLLAGLASLAPSMGVGRQLAAAHTSPGLTLLDVPEGTTLHNYRGTLPQLADADPMHLLLARSAAGGVLQADVPAAGGGARGARPTGPRQAPALKDYLPGGTRESTHPHALHLSPGGILQLFPAKGRLADNDDDVTADKMILAYHEIAATMAPHQAADLLQFGMTIIRHYWDVYPHKALLKFERAIRSKHLCCPDPDTFRYGAPSDHEHQEQFLTIIVPSAVSDSVYGLLARLAPQIAPRRSESGAGGGGGGRGGGGSAPRQDTPSFMGGGGGSGRGIKRSAPEGGSGGGRGRGGRSSPNGGPKGGRGFGRGGGGGQGSRSFGGGTADEASPATCTDWATGHRCRKADEGKGCPYVHHCQWCGRDLRMGQAADRATCETCAARRSA
jgi:hypothetical protein